jgi:hypothetical protein
MKVVHFWNICGIGGLLARYMDRDYDYETVAIDRGHANRYSHNNEKTIVWENRASLWVAKCLLYARKFDIIHIHSGIQWVKYFHSLYPKKPLVLHLHGTKIRGRWELEPDVRFADQIIVSTPDLLEGAPEGTWYLPNPVDEELCAKVMNSTWGKRLHSAFHVDRYALDRAEQYALKYGLELEVFNRDEAHLPHEEFLEKMARHEYYINVERSKYLWELAVHTFYIDVKRDYPGTAFQKKLLKAWSLTGLEALAMGCKVIDWNGKIHEGLPREHRSRNVTDNLHHVYSGLFE